MNSSAVRLLQAALWSFCAFHVIVGVGLNVSGDFPKAMAAWYGATSVNWDEQFVYTLKPLGAFMLVLGALAGVAALNPLKHREIAYAFAGLFILRALQRLAFGEEVAAFGIPPERNMANMAFFLLLGLAVLGLLRCAEGQTRGTPPNAAAA